MRAHESDILQPLLTDGKANLDSYFWSYEGEIPLLDTPTPKVMIAALGKQMLKVPILMMDRFYGLTAKKSVSGLTGM